MKCTFKKINLGQRFGDGLYFTATSSKANDYSEKTEEHIGNGMRSILVCSVVAGNVLKKTKDDKVNEITS